MKTSIGYNNKQEHILNQKPNKNELIHNGNILNEI